MGCWRDAPAGCGPHKTIYNRFIRWRRFGVFNRIWAEFAARGSGSYLHLKGHRTAPKPAQKELYPDVSGAAEVD
jgi:transposase